MVFQKISTLLLLALLGLQSSLVNATGTDLNNATQIKDVEIKTKEVPQNPKHGDLIWGPLRVGMSVEEVLVNLPNSVFDDQWSSSGMVGVMAEAGILAANKIKVTAPIEKGPFDSQSTLYVFFDELSRLDGVVILTKKNDLPKEVMVNYGTLGFYLPEYKEAAKSIIKNYSIPELGKRVGPPRFGKERLDSIGSIGVGKAIGSNSGLGIGFSMGSISPASIGQKYDRDGYRSMLVVKSVYLGTYNIYSAVMVFMAIQAKLADEIEDVE